MFVFEAEPLRKAAYRRCNFEKALQIVQGQETAETNVAQLNRLTMCSRCTSHQEVVKSLLTKGRISTHLKYRLFQAINGNPPV